MLKVFLPSYVIALLFIACPQAFPAQSDDCPRELRESRVGAWLDKTLGSVQMRVRRMSRGSVKPPVPAQVEAITALLADHPFPAPILAPTVQRLLKTTGLSPAELVDMVAILVRPHSLPTVSGFYVGAAAYVSEGSEELPSGSIIFGNNLELPGNLLTAGTCAEAALVGRATMLGVRKISHLSVWGGVGATGAPLAITPCTHCRQLLNELDAVDELRIRVAGRPVSHLSDLFPDPFGPKDLGIVGGLLAHAHRTPAVVASRGIALSAEEKTALQAAADAAARSYVPYSNTEFGIALVACTPGNPNACVIASGADMEGANFHGTKSSLVTAISDLTSRHANVFRSTAEAIRSIRSVFLFERNIDSNRPILKSSIDTTVATLRSLQRQMFPDQTPIRIFRVTVDGTSEVL